MVFKRVLFELRSPFKDNRYKTILREIFCIYSFQRNVKPNVRTVSWLFVVVEINTLDFTSEHYFERLTFDTKRTPNFEFISLRARLNLVDKHVTQNTVHNKSKLICRWGTSCWLESVKSVLFLISVFASQRYLCGPTNLDGHSEL